MSTAQEQMAIPPVWRALYYEINGENDPRIPDGTPFVRDIDAPCEAFEPFDEAFVLTRRHGDCESDGHHICVECIHITQDRFREKRDLCRDCGAPLEHVDTLNERCSAHCNASEVTPLPTPTKDT